MFEEFPRALAALTGVLLLGAVACGPKPVDTGSFPSGSPLPAASVTPETPASPGELASPGTAGSPSPLASPGTGASPAASPGTKASPGAKASPVAVASPDEATVPDAGPAQRLKDQVFAVTITDEGLESDGTKVPLGTNVTFKVTNKSKRPMGIRAEGMKNKEIKAIAPGSTEDLAMKPGPGPLTLTVPGESGKGFQLKLTVVPPTF